MRPRGGIYPGDSTPAGFVSEFPVNRHFGAGSGRTVVRFADESRAWQNPKLSVRLALAWRSICSVPRTWQTRPNMLDSIGFENSNVARCTMDIEVTRAEKTAMQPFKEFTALVTSERERRANFKTLLSCVLPRPIAFVSTMSSSGIYNLAPFSFFNGVGSNPPAVVFSPCTKADGTDKDTLNNLRDGVREFVINVVPHDICGQVNDASSAFEPEVDEFEAVGFTPVESRFVKPPRVAESPVHMECKLIDIVPVGDGPLSANICIGEILCFHVAAEMLLDNGTVDVSKIDLVGRLGGDDYSTIRDRFALPKPYAKPVR